MTTNEAALRVGGRAWWHGERGVPPAVRLVSEYHQGDRKGLHPSHPLHMRCRSRRRGTPGRPQGSPPLSSTSHATHEQKASNTRATARVSTPLIHLSRPYNDYGRSGSSGGRPSMVMTMAGKG